MPGSRAVRVSLTGRQGDSSVCSGITRKPMSNSGSPGVCTYVAKLTVTFGGKGLPRGRSDESRSVVKREGTRKEGRRAASDRWRFCMLSKDEDTTAKV